MWRSITGKMLTLNRSQCCVYVYNLNYTIAICRNYLNYLEQGNTPNNPTNWYGMTCPTSALDLWKILQE